MLHAVSAYFFICKPNVSPEFIFIGIGINLNGYDPGIKFINGDYRRFLFCRVVLKIELCPHTAEPFLLDPFGLVPLPVP